MRFCIKTFGCRTNIAESDELSQKLQTFYNPAAERDADFIIIRACAVTAGAEQGVRQAIRAYKKQGKIVYVLGCFLKKIPEADAYFKNDKNFLKYLYNHNLRGRASYGNHKNIKNDVPKNNRAFIKIQSGCDFDCAFCVTRIIKGKSKNISETKILSQIKNAQIRGAKEIVLTGTNILLYKNIAGLIKKILAKIPVPRVRFGSVDPRLITNNFITLFKNKRLMPHLHLSLQSGSEKILKEMGRPVKIEKIKRLAAALRRINPLFNISADIIAGFPGESEADFRKTLALAKKLRLSKIHCFSYSPRPGTKAEKLKPVNNAVVKKRLLRLQALDNNLQNAAKNRIIGQSLTVLFECGKNFVYYGYAPNFIRIKKRSKKNLTDEIKEIIIKKNN